MGRLKDKMEGDLQLRGLCRNTREAYLRCARMFVRHYMKSPEQLGKTEVRDYLLQMLQQRKWTPSTYNVHSAAYIPRPWSGHRKWRGLDGCAWCTVCPPS